LAYFDKYKLQEPLDWMRSNPSLPSDGGTSVTINNSSIVVSRYNTFGYWYAEHLRSLNIGAFILPVFCSLTSTAT
jgi:hypothetical protein